MIWTKTIRNKIMELQVQFEPILPQLECNLQVNLAPAEASLKMKDAIANSLSGLF